MPCINIRLRREGVQLDIKGFAHKLAQQMDIEVERINIIVDYYDETDAFMGSNADQLIIILWISERNEKQFIKNLVKSTADLAKKYFHKEGRSTAVMCNLIKEGHLFISNQIKKEE
ncbi:hypothetical protein [Alkaliphilus peptidifermentans]|uniref:Tautomerase enzyme n=1 Tax=Alkaliphilus peptidifermentans DSM 18978 TaxID=1120976 RepID=A0A1G5L121_9FIRM|nr:hypothetical protein [Alkaliphilus peptidifermentans]SCZ06000.1 hypothetical protein SAMN03080606_03920 [Alkaliphilus peptidifermentans DSM 18978]